MTPGDLRSVTRTISFRQIQYAVAANKPPTAIEPRIADVTIKLTPSELKAADPGASFAELKDPTVAVGDSEYCPLTYGIVRKIGQPCRGLFLASQIGFCGHEFVQYGIRQARISK